MGVYTHKLEEGIHCPDHLGKIVCVGRNYAEHAKELNNPIPKQPLLFIKPATAAVPMNVPFAIPDNFGACQHELEMAVLIGSDISGATAEQAKKAIAGVGLGLDLTLRDLQSQLKEKGQPWERAKSFDGACPLSHFVAVKNVELQNLEIQLLCNNTVRQKGNTADMLFSVADLLADISQVFTLLAGDVVLTGTPAGVADLYSGDQLKASLGSIIEVTTAVR